MNSLSKRLPLSHQNWNLSGGSGQVVTYPCSRPTEESGLILACSVKTLMFKDGKTKNYQKNLTNRRGDLLIEAVTLHRRFPYSVIAGFLFLDAGAAEERKRRCRDRPRCLR